MIAVTVQVFLNQAACAKKVREGTIPLYSKKTDFVPSFSKKSE